MKPNASVLAIASALSLAALAGLAVACSPSSVTESPGASPSAAPIAAPANQPSSSPSPAVSPSIPTAQKQTTETAPTTTPAANRTVESCVVRMALVNDPNPPLNVRSAPTTEGDNVVGQLKNNTLVTVADDQNGWLQIKSPLKGWISKAQTTHSCNEKVERLSLNADGATMSIADRFVGPGSHRYVFPASKGQTLTVTHDRGPFPMIIAPDGTVLLGHEKDDKRDTWSGTVEQTGDYTLQLESNFRGYRYGFSMQVK
ncbi:MAG: SH3 domain-containing protein [Leptolyngbya sp. BL-A-14]